MEERFKTLKTGDGVGMVSVGGGYDRLPGGWAPQRHHGIGTRYEGTVECPTSLPSLRRSWFTNRDGMRVFHSAAFPRAARR
jgi:hypothetical protein